MKRPDIAVVGGGLLGRCLAWRASRTGARVALYDAASSQGEDSAAWVAAGMITPTVEGIEADSQIQEKGKHSLAVWPQWLAELPAPVFYRDSGTLLLWHRQDAQEAFRVERVLAAQHRNANVKRINSAQLDELEPAVASRFSQALCISNEAQLDNRELLRQLRSLSKTNVSSAIGRLSSGIVSFPKRKLLWIAVEWAPDAIGQDSAARSCASMHPK
jgi:glycine oxidase